MTQTAQTTLADFLLARIAEDEIAADEAIDYVHGRLSVCDEYGHLGMDKSRVLAECDAKRRIVEQYENPPYGGYGYGLWYALACLALPYGDHADYRAEWRP